MLTDLNPEAFSPIIQAIVYDSALSCLIISRDGRLSFINPRLAESLNVDAAVQPEAERWLHVPSERPDGQAEPESLRPVLEQVFSGRSWSGELMLSVRGGGITRQQAMLTPIFDSQGQPNGVLGILKPMTDGHQPVLAAASAGQPAAIQSASVDTAGRGVPRQYAMDDPADLLDVQQGLRRSGNDAARYERRLLRFSASYENAAEDLLALLRHNDRTQVRCYLEALESAADSIGAGQAARLAAEIGQLAASPANLVPTPVLALFENLMLALQEQILDTIDLHSAAVMLPELDRRLDASSLDPLLRDLMAYLQNYDLNAIDTFNQLVDGAAGVPRYSGIELARPYLESFNFEKALRIVESVWQRAHGSPSATADGKRDPVHVGLGSTDRTRATAGRLSRRPPRRRTAMPADEADPIAAAGTKAPAKMDDLAAIGGGRA